MMYPFMTLEDNTEIVHSEQLENGEVKVYIETPDEMKCYTTKRTAFIASILSTDSIICILFCRMSVV